MNYPKLKAVLDDWLPNGSFSDFRQWFINQINNGDINDDTISEWLFACLFRENPDSDTGRLWSAFTFTILADLALRNDERDKAWALAVNAGYYCGLSAAIVEYECFKKDDKEWLDTRRYARSGRTDRYEGAKKLVIETLKNPPEGGWGDGLTTRRKIVHILEKFLVKNFNEKRISNPDSKNKNSRAKAPDLLRKWFNEVKEIQDAYSAHCSKSS